MEQSVLNQSLEEAFCDKKTVAKHVIVRSLICGLFFFGIFICAENTAKDYGSTAYYIRSGAICAVMALYCFGPLRHLKDHLVYYSNGIRFNKRELVFTPATKLSWINRHTYVFGNQLILGYTTENKGVKGILDLFRAEFNVTYLKDAKGKYIKAYMNTQEGR